MLLVAGCLNIAVCLGVVLIPSVRSLRMTVGGGASVEPAA